MSELVTAIRELTNAVKILIDQQSPQPKNLLSLDEAATLLGVHSKTISTYRQAWVSGVHYFPQGKGHLYNRELLEDWLKNRRDSAQHQLAIAAWIRKNQP
jgi:hypothetical protein